MYLLLIFDTVEYTNCLIELFIFFNECDYKKIIKKYENNIKHGFIDYIIYDFDNDYELIGNYRKYY